MREKGMTARRESRLTAAWQASENNRRARYYRLTKAGRRQLGEETTLWNPASPR
jgi:PadR family transcriptional regulator, regulatory protein PadR